MSPALPRGGSPLTGARSARSQTTGRFGSGWSWGRPHEAIVPRERRRVGP
jgi:hypothetical protein